MIYKGKVLTIAGSDSSGGAGIQADIKTITVHGCYAASCITSVTVQDTARVYESHDLPIKLVQDQIIVVLNDIGVDAIKIGMLSDAKIIKAVSCVLPKNVPIIFDPVMVATTGFSLAKGNVVNFFKEYIISKSYIITPNIPEAESLADMKISTLEDMDYAASKILEYGSYAVLIKGAHLNNSVIHNILLTKEYRINFSHDRISEKDFHGTGCSLSSSIASFISQGYDLRDSVDRAIKYVCEAIKQSSTICIGKGFSPIWHNIT